MNTQSQHNFTEIVSHKLFPYPSNCPVLLPLCLRSGPILPLTLLSLTPSRPYIPDLSAPIFPYPYPPTHVDYKYHYRFLPFRPSFPPSSPSLPCPITPPSPACPAHMSFSVPTPHPSHHLPFLPLRPPIPPSPPRQLPVPATPTLLPCVGSYRSLPASGCAMPAGSLPTM